MLADFTKKVNALTAPPEERARLVAGAREALSGPFRRGYNVFLEALDAVEPQAKSNDGAWRLPRGAEYYANNLRNSTTTDSQADQIHQTGLDEVKRIQGEMEQIKDRVGFKGTLQQFFAHIKNGQQFKYPNTEGGREQYLKDANAFIAPGHGEGAAIFPPAPQGAAGSTGGREVAREYRSGRLLQLTDSGRVEAGHLLRQLADMTQV
jgi:uncharacterized protein (DUF885 family)